MKEFSKEVRDQLECYVYGLIDPRNGKYFYIGKGQGNRVFEHIKEAFKSDDSERDKIKTIRDIHNAGLEVIHIILRHKLSEQEALIVESTLIDFIGLKNLDNEVSGINTDCGMNNAKILQDSYSREEFTENAQTPLFMIIKIRQDKLDEREGSYYETCRSAWKISPQKANKYPYVLCVLNGVVKEVYERIGEWKPDHRYRENRFEFEGKVADEAIREFFINKRIPKKYCKKGMASPVLYSNQKDND